RPNDQEVLTATASAFEMLEEFPAALELEKRLFAVGGNPRLKLQMAQNLFMQGDINGANAEIQWVLDNRQITDTVIIQQPRTDTREMQQIKIRAAAYYILGEMYLQLGKKAEARKAFNEAIKIEPYYDMAARRLL